jgi:hypothetical protein
VSKAYQYVYNTVNKLPLDKWHTSTSGWGALRCMVDGRLMSLIKLRRKFLKEQFKGWSAVDFSAPASHVYVLPGCVCGRACLSVCVCV